MSGNGQLTTWNGLELVRSGHPGAVSKNHENPHPTMSFLNESNHNPCGAGKNYANEWKSLNHRTQKEVALVS